MTTHLRACAALLVSACSSNTVPGDVGTDAATADVTTPVDAASDVVVDAASEAGWDVSVLASNQNGAVGIAVDSTNVYWSNFDPGLLQTCPAGGCGVSPTRDRRLRGNADARHQR